ncbi:hypothetical protein CB0940_04326 [Cercospora beticola]|uniref:C2H2-type domain-containing protein n=1 Tax=Cercospora beticola TaxID=122368 RepID=A0A2G5HKE3_CERBT|nr:hypothetical protein CB0940_04326 [Cercospora beticola]PIA93031.1 hypothetical protein CB0940_04326 [Cercospora beticola]WPB01559.1 hypothetical protein RHO25_006186 [Cercospora beticola]
MASTTQLNSGDAILRDNTHDESTALDPEQVAAILNCNFLDVNEEDAQLQRYLAGQPETAFTANGLEIPGPALPALSDGPSPSASCANSAIALHTPEPEYNEDNLNAGEVLGQNGLRNTDGDYNLDDYINSSAYEPADIVKTEQQMPDPPILHQSYSEPFVTTKTEKPPLTRSSPSAGALLESPTDAHNDLHRSLSKRGRQDTSNDFASSVKRAPSKRMKQQKGGYPCLGCTETFDRACDQKKHYQRTHAPKDSHPHSCPDCQEHGIVKAFLYPKDLRRHFKQVHSKIITNISTGRKASNASPVSATSPKNFGLWALCKTVVSFKKLRIIASSPGHKLIMVSQDQKSFFEVDVSGVLNPDGLVSRILETLGVDSDFPHEFVQAQTYSRQYGLGQKLDAQSAFQLVRKNADTQGSFKLIISAADAYTG